jgi:probable HAF family extracellular repeat protein
MSIRSLLDALTRTTARRGPVRRHPRLSVEPMEDRSVPNGYAVMDLGSLVEGGASQASDINLSGQVVGWADAGGGNEHAFLWQNGLMTSLGTLGGNVSRAAGLNDRGQVVGFSNLGGSTVAYRAFLLTPEDTDLNGTPDRWFRDTNADGANDLMLNLGTLGGTNPISVARDINNRGQVVGNASGDSKSGSFNRAFMWQDGVMSILGTLGGNYSLASAINDAGQVTGMSTDAISNQHTVLWTNGSLVDLGMSYGATDINHTGQVIDSNESPRLWTPTVPNGSAGAFSGLGFLPLPHYWPVESWATATPRGMNNAAHVVGHQIDYYSYGEEWSAGAPRGVLWAGGVPEELPVEFAEAINDSGLIAGNSGLRAFVLTPIATELPTISIGDATVTEGHFGTQSVTFTVTLSAASAEAVSVTYATANGMAIAGHDYAAVSGTLTFDPRQTTNTVTVLVTGDRLGEVNETFVLGLTNPNNATVADGWGLGTIVDDEPRISIDDFFAAEGKKGQTTLFTFTVTLSATYDQPVTVSFRTMNGTATTANGDYVARSGTLTFATGETTKTITVEVKGDNKREGNEYFYLDLFGNSDNSLLTRNRGLGTILNDD